MVQVWNSVLHLLLGIILGMAILLLVQRIRRYGDNQIDKTHDDEKSRDLEDTRDEVS